MDETMVDDALNLDSSGTFELGRAVVPIPAAETDADVPDFPAAKRRRDSRHSEFHSFAFDADESLA